MPLSKADILFATTIKSTIVNACLNIMNVHFVPESGLDPAEWGAKLEDRFYNNHSFKVSKSIG